MSGSSQGSTECSIPTNSNPVSPARRVSLMRRPMNWSRRWSRESCRLFHWAACRAEPRYISSRSEEYPGSACQKSFANAAADELVAALEQGILQTLPLGCLPGGAPIHLFGQDLLGQLILFNQKFGRLRAHQSCALVLQRKQQLIVPAARLGQVGKAF